ncbi:MAG: hypothetical protein AAGA68_24720 [Pseudomonadota bacterium]
MRISMLPFPCGRFRTVVPRRVERRHGGALVLLALLFVGILGACTRAPISTPGAIRGAATEPVPVDCAVALVPHRGDAPVDAQIRQYQREAIDQPSPNTKRYTAWIERLGWAYVSASRVHQDEGFLTLAEQAGGCLQALAAPSRSHPAELLLGHAYHQQHRFHEAERMARALVATRGHWYDHGLLGDVLLDVGKLEGARIAYQRLADLRPGPQAYQRAGELRWMLGDVMGAREMLTRAVNSLRTGDPHVLGAVAVRLAELQWQLADQAAALRTLDALTALNARLPSADYLRGRILLSAGEASAASPYLRRAAEASELPAHRWALVDALREAGEVTRVQEQALLSSLVDRRTQALFLATHGRDVERALALAEAELTARRDPLTLYAAAFAALQASDLERASRYADEADAFEIREARACLHGALLSERLGKARRLAKQWSCARTYEHMLLPSERLLFDRLQTRQHSVARAEIEANRRP